MKWGQSLSVPYLQGDLGLLYHALEFFVMEYFSQDYARTINDSLLDSLLNGLGMGNGNMNWDIDRIQKEDGTIIFNVSSDPDFISDGISSEAVFDEATFKRIFKEILSSYAIEYPDKGNEVKNIINRYF